MFLSSHQKPQLGSCVRSRIDGTCIPYLLICGLHITIRLLLDWMLNVCIWVMSDGCMSVKTRISLHRSV